MFSNVTDCCKTPKMCDKAVEKNPIRVRYIPTRFITKQRVIMLFL